MLKDHRRNCYCVDVLKWCLFELVNIFMCLWLACFFWFLLHVTALPRGGGIVNGWKRNVAKLTGDSCVAVLKGCILLTWWIPLHVVLVDLLCIGVMLVIVFFCYIMSLACDNTPRWRGVVNWTKTKDSNITEGRIILCLCIDMMSSWACEFPSLLIVQNTSVFWHVATLPQGYIIWLDL